MKKRIFATLLALVMALGLCVTTAWAEDEVKYLDADGTTGTCTDYTTVTSASGTEAIWYDGWYVVKGNVEINGPVVIRGAAKLILYDGATLTVKTTADTPINIKSSIHNGSLTVYGQAGQSGTLNVETEQASIGIRGSITVNSGKVTVHGCACGIYGNVTVNGGTVIAEGEFDGISDNVIVNGGTVIAESNNDGIGGNVELPASYKWRTTKDDGTFTKNSVKEYSNDSKPEYVEIVACHDFGTWVNEIPATCTATGARGHYTCSVCEKNFDADGKEITDPTIQKDPGNHAEDGVWHSDRKTHWMTYDACCGITTAAEAHNFDGRTCTVCGYKKPVTSGSTATTVTETTTVASPKTADAGVLLSGALALTSLLGMGYIGKKR